MKRSVDKRAIDILTLFNIFDLALIGRLLEHRLANLIFRYAEPLSLLRSLRENSIEGIEKKGGCRR